MRKDFNLYYRTKLHNASNQFKEKPSKEEIKKIILDDMNFIDNQLPKPTSYLLSKNNETLYEFDINGCMIENYKFKKLIKKSIQKLFYWI